MIWKERHTMFAKTTTLKNASGLHARPASEFVALAKQFESRVFLRNLDKPGAEPANAKSIVRVLAEGIPSGAQIELSAEGADAQEAICQLIAMVESGFGEE